MADILIRGMEIPKNEPLTITITPEGKVFRAFIPGSYGEVIPLPEGYGRLIDADDTLKKIPKVEHGVYELRFQGKEYDKYKKSNGLGFGQDALKVLESLLECFAKYGPKSSTSIPF